VWRSWLARSIRVAEVGGSSPLTPTRNYSFWYYGFMHMIDFNTKIEGKKQGAFVIFYALDGKPWSSYAHASNRAKLTIPTCLMINRSDGWVGFVGGW
jgi:hypothetical protein